MKRHAGYSLTEMLIVLLIVAVLSSMLIGAYGRFQRNTRLTTSVDKVLSTLALARSLAISHNTIYHVRLDHWDATNSQPNSEPLLKVFCYPRYNDAVRVKADPGATSDAWSIRGALKDQTGTAYLGPAGLPINNYVVETVKLDRGVFIGQQLTDSYAPTDPDNEPRDELQNNMVSFNSDGTATQSNQNGIFILYVTDIDKMARQLTDESDRRAAYNKVIGAKFQRSNVIMIEVLPGGIIRTRKNDLP